MAFVLREVSSICQEYQVGSLMRVLQSAGANCKVRLRGGSRDEESAAWVTGCVVICKDERSKAKVRGG